ncbi:MAG: prolyl oligopeptidase family serine peptidase [Bdellovibrionales bacterium]|nr:prolyl oligopeptidase family serine peptidase [Bdellovibrionales bacterium]
MPHDAWMQQFKPHDHQTLAKAMWMDTLDQEWTKYFDDCEQWYTHLPPSIEFSRMVYHSDGLQVHAILGKSKEITIPAPAIIYNRGGNRGIGMLNVCELKNLFYPLIQKGYVVVGSQYRGNDGGEGKEEFGGADVNDVIHLHRWLSTQKFVDRKNIFMMGGSRGAMMSMLAIRKGLAVNAVATRSGLFDLRDAPYDESPFGKMLWDKVFTELIPNIDTQQKQVLLDRSPIVWADEIKTPTLIIQGVLDNRLDKDQAIKMHKALKDHGTDTKLILYEDDHRLSHHLPEAIDQIDQWFHQYRK